MSSRISQQELESYLWGAAVLLRGTIDAGDYKQFIFPLLFYKRLCDVFDEETQIALNESGGDQAFAAYPEIHRFQIPSEAHWKAVRQAAKNVGNALQSSMRAIETANPDKLYGIFGDAQWTNKERLSDAMLRDLIEHFSTLDLTAANLPEDELGQGYEFLIKKFADDSGHTAAEFYTNRTVVHLMTEMLEPRPGESIYDPTCGSGGMLLSCITQLRRQKQEWRNVRLYGQERNLMTSSIARMNCFLHGIEDFQIVRGDTLGNPKLVQGDRLMEFDIVLANPPYSIKQWDRDAFASDPWGRNLHGTPPQGRADYAFWQHILVSLAPKTGRCAILFPHGVLFRQEEAEMRRKIIDADVIECVIGLGPNLFYNSPMEACVVICRANKPKARKGRILFINAVNEVTRERSRSFLTDEQIERIAKAYESFKKQVGFSAVATLEELRSKDGSLSIPLYVEPAKEIKRGEVRKGASLTTALTSWLKSRDEVTSALTELVPTSKPTVVKTQLPDESIAELFKDKASWTRVRFGDVVENVNNTESDPFHAGLERFIGLEHLEPGSLHIREWGNVSDGTTFTRCCQPGQVLFGKRRAYQRKVAVAHFEAVVSGDIYVLKPKDDRLFPGLLPFLCLSERFFQHAVGTSAGSLSPRTNWNSLASFEFELPTLDQQRRIADILWAVDGSEESYLSLKRSHIEYMNSLSHPVFTCGIDDDGHPRRWADGKLKMTTIGPLPLDWSAVPLRDFAIEKGVVNGPFGSDLLTSELQSEGVPVIYVRDVKPGRYTRVSTVNVSPEKARTLAFCDVQSGDVVVAKVGEPPCDAAPYLLSEPSIVTQDVMRIRPRPDVDCHFIVGLLNSSFGRAAVKRITIGGGRMRVSLTEFKSLVLPKPPLVEQARIGKAVEAADELQRKFESHLVQLRRVKQDFIETLLGEQVK